MIFGILNLLILPGVFTMGSSMAVSQDNIDIKDGLSTRQGIPYRWNGRQMASVPEPEFASFKCTLESYEQAVKNAKNLLSKVEPVEKPGPKNIYPTYGWMDLAGDGKKSFVEVRGGFGTASGEYWLSIVPPGMTEKISLTMSWMDTDMYKPPLLQWSDNANDPAYVHGRMFLDKVKYACNYVPEEVILAQPGSPRFAAHIWGKENGSIEEGWLTLRKIRGKIPEHLLHSKLRWVEGDMTFVGSGDSLFAYNPKTEEHFLVFHCDNIYAGPSVLTKAGPWLLIGLWMEGLVAIDLKEFYLKRFSTINCTIRKIEGTKSEVIIDEGKHRLPLPIERSGEKIRSYFFGPRGLK